MVQLYEVCLERDNKVHQTEDEATKSYSVLTNMAEDSLKSRPTLALKGAQPIHAGGTVLARAAGALVNLCGAKKEQAHTEGCKLQAVKSNNYQTFTVIFSVRFTIK